MSNAEFVMVQRELAERIAASIGYEERDELREILAKPYMHQGEPVAWLAKCKKSGLVEQAEPNEKASNPEHWTDAFPVYSSSVEYEIAGYEGSSGLYYSRLAAVANGEQSVEPVYRVKK